MGIPRGPEEGLESRILNGFMLEFPPRERAGCESGEKIMLREWVREVSRFLNSRGECYWRQVFRSVSLPEQFRQRGLGVGIVGRELYQLLRVPDRRRQVPSVSLKGDQSCQHLAVGGAELVSLLQDCDCLVWLSSGIERHCVDIAIANIGRLQLGRSRQQAERLLILLLPNFEQAKSKNGFTGVGRGGDRLFQPSLT